MTLLRKKDKNESLADIEVTVRFLDDSDPKTFRIKREHTGQWLFDQVCQDLNLLEKDYFGLRYTDADRQRHWLEPVRAIHKQIKGNGPVVFSFRVKYYPSDCRRLQEEITRYFLFLQVRRDLQMGRLLAPPDIATRLAAYVVQEELGDYDPEDHPSGYLEEMSILPRHTPQLNANIHEAHVTVRGLVPAEAEEEFLRQAAELDTYGVDPHPVKDAQGKFLFVGVTFKGLASFSGSQTVQAINWSEVHKLSFEGKLFIVHLTETASNSTLSPASSGSNSTRKRAIITYRCPTNSAAKYLWRCALEHQAFFRMPKAVQVPKVSSGGFLRSSKFRYSGRCLEELLPEYTRNKREDADFVRSPSRVSLMNAHKQPSLQSQPFQRKLEERPKRPRSEMLQQGDIALSAVSAVEGDVPVTANGDVVDQSVSASSLPSPPRTLTSTDVYSQLPVDGVIEHDEEQVTAPPEEVLSQQPRSLEAEEKVELVEVEVVHPEHGSTAVLLQEPQKETAPVAGGSSAPQPASVEEQQSNQKLGEATLASGEASTTLTTPGRGAARGLAGFLLSLLLVLLALVLLLELLPPAALRQVAPLVSARQAYASLRARLLALIS